MVLRYPMEWVAIGWLRLRWEDIDPKSPAKVEELDWLDRELHGLANSL